MKEVVIQDLTEPVKMLKKCGIWCIQTVNQAYYVEIYMKLTMIQLSRHSVMQFQAQKSITEMEHPPCSHDLALSDLWLFPKIKS